MKENIKYFKDIPTLLSALNTVAPKHNQIHIHRLEDVKDFQVLETSIFRSDTYVIAFLSQGEAKYTIGLSDYQMKAGSLYFQSAKHLRYYQRLSNWKGYVIIFTDEFISKFTSVNIPTEFPFFAIDANVLMQLEDDEQPPFVELFDKIWHDFTDDKQITLTIIWHYLNILLLKIKQRYNREQQLNATPLSRNVVLYKSFEHLLEQHFFEIAKRKTAKIFSVSDFADKLNITTNHLSDAVKKAVGKTPTQIIKDRIILESKSLLHSTDCSISEIAFLLHFEDPAYFTKFFKSAAGLTPIDFRKQNQ